MKDFRQSREYVKYVQKLGWKVEEIEGKNPINVFVKRIPLLGSVIKIQRPLWPIDFLEIEKIARLKRAIFVKIEPDIVKGYENEKREKELELNGYKRDGWPLLPTKTVWIDLTEPLEEIFEKMSKDSRYCIRKAEDLESYESGDVVAFYEILKGSMKIGNWQIPIKNNVVFLFQAFAPYNARIIFAKKDREIVSGAMLVFHGEVAHYAYAGTTTSGRKLRGSYKVLWESIKLAKKLGYEIIDLEGVYDERFPKLNRKWLGFTHFKEGFGGRAVYYSGSFIKYYSPLFSLFFKIFTGS